MTKREQTSINRSMEHFSETELQKQIGHGREYWIVAIVKELVDNALDATEEVRRLPEITIDIQTCDGSIAVKDNGPGMPQEAIVGFTNPNVRSSTRAAYRGPTRGSQGNASKCLIGLPYVMNEGECTVSIATQGKYHTIRVGINELERTPVISHSVISAPMFVEGTVIGFDVPPDNERQLVKIDRNPKVTKLASSRSPGFAKSYESVDCEGEIGKSAVDEIILFVDSASRMNPHAKFNLVLNGEEVIWERRSSKIDKWTAANAEEPGWHNKDSFADLVAATIQNDRRAGVDRPLSQFVSTFSRMTGTAKQKLVIARTGMTRPTMADLTIGDSLNRDLINVLYDALLIHSPSPGVEKLGRIGKSNMNDWLRSYGIDEATIKYQRCENSAPYCIEIGFAELLDPSEDRVMVSGINFSPAIKPCCIEGLEDDLAENRIDRSSPVVILVHVAMVSPPFRDRGKSMMQPDFGMSINIYKAINRVAKDWLRKLKAHERGEAKSERRKPSQQTTTLQDAVIDVLPAAIAKASDDGRGGRADFSNRDLYYVARKLVQQYTIAGLKQSYFDTIVDRYESENGLIEGRQKKARGCLIQPHDHDNPIPLGTKEVAEYDIPFHRYHAILFVEKDGVAQRLLELADRYDIAIMSSQGFAVAAAKQLLQNAQTEHAMKVFCLHDADPSGKEIALELGESTGAREFDIDVIDIGLSLDEAVEMGLDSEEFTRKKKLSKSLPMTELEREWWTGKATEKVVNGKPRSHWESCKRIELNALSSDYRRFVNWVEGKLIENGITASYQPPFSVAESEANRCLEIDARDAIRRVVMNELGVDAMVDAVYGSLRCSISPSEIARTVLATCENPQPHHWTAYTTAEVAARIDDASEGILDDVRLAVSQLGSRKNPWKHA